MTSQPALVTDTNIWIDLENGNLLLQVFRRPYRFLIPDFAISELIHPRWETLEASGLEAHELAAEQVAELFQLRQTYKSLSTSDLAAFLLAKRLGAMLLTGDRHLNELAISNGLTVHGVLWLLDELVHFRVLAPGQAVSALNRIVELGARLPTEECERRLTAWSK